MVYYDTGTNALRKENIESVIKGIALQKFTMKQAVSIDSSNAWSESYYRESASNLGGETNIARGAMFPVSNPVWEKNTAYMKKAGLESEILFEDEITNNIAVIARTELRLSHRLAQMVDNTIYTALVGGASTANNVVVNDSAHWDSTTRANRHPQDDIAQAIENIEENNYEATHIFVNPHDYMRLVTNDDILDAFTPTANILQNGVMGQLLGLTLVKSMAVPNDEALVLQAKTCGTYRVAQEASVAVEKIEGIKTIIRVFEIGTAFVTDPLAISRITNTQV